MYPVVMKRKPPSKVEIFEFPIKCPGCGTNVIVVSPMEQILADRRTCPSCEKEFFIADGKPIPSGGPN